MLVGQPTLNLPRFKLIVVTLLAEYAVELELELCGTCVLYHGL